jgi:hypothetical protein
MARSLLHLLLASSITTLAFACSSTGNVDDTGSAESASHRAGSSHSASADGGTTDSATTKPVTTIFTIVMENHDYAEIVGSPNAPYINGLIATYGLATSYMDSGIHPSLPNYLTMISGDPQYAGGTDLLPTASPFPKTAENLGSQLEAANIPWRSYQESMGSPCLLTTATSPSGSYAPKHDPFLYFSDTQAPALCTKTNVDYAQFPADLAAGTYRYMWITPNLTNDGHDPTTNQAKGAKTSDAWAKTEIPKILASAAYQNGGVIFLTWDEAEGRSGHSKDQIPMIVISENLKTKPFSSNTPHSHRSYLATVEDLLGLPRLATVETEPAMMEFFE